MKPLALILLIIFFMQSCKKDKEDFEIVSGVQFVEFGSCFLEYRIKETQVIISNDSVYTQFEKDLKNNWDFTGSCNSAKLPSINFETSFLIGKYTENLGCDASYNREIFYNSKMDKYKYDIAVTYTLGCNTKISSFNWAIIPRQSNSLDIVFE